MELVQKEGTRNVKRNVEFYNLDAIISVGLFRHSRDFEVWENMYECTLTKIKEMLDDMHKRKIDMADEIFVINVGGYISESTKFEIEYALLTNKRLII